jgi:hypothetical protein
MNSRNQRVNAINDYFPAVIVQEIMEYDDDVKLKAIHNKEKVNTEIPEYFEASCDACVKGWNYKNEFGLCNCMCSICYGCYRDCRGECRE